MEPLTVAVLVAITAAVAVVATVLVLRQREHRSADEPPGAHHPQLPPGVGQVLSVLRSSAVVLDVADGVVEASPAAYAFGLVRGEELAHPELRQLAREVRVDGVVREVELELARGPLGQGQRVGFARVAALDGRHVLVLVEDRTEARRLEEIRRDFVANVSHELKTPVGALSLLSEAVIDAAEDPEAVRRFATRMQRESGRLSTLVQEIIDLSRLQVADTLLAPEQVSVDDVVADAVDRCRLNAEAKQIDVVVGGEHGRTVYGNRDLLVTAVRNLVDNAVAYSDPGTRVGLGVRSGEGLVEVSVTDQGIGIPSDDLGRVFERFYRVDPARSRATGGTGLGLSIVKHVVANHGGEVRVWSREGEGSTFTVRLPDSSPVPDRRSSQPPAQTRVPEEMNP